MPDSMIIRVCAAHTFEFVCKNCCESGEMSSYALSWWRTLIVLLISCAEQTRVISLKLLTVQSGNHGTMNEENRKKYLGYCT